MNLCTSCLVILLISKIVDSLEPEGIQGGYDAQPGMFTYHVIVEMYNEFLCGGAVIDDRHVVTAAHCVADRTGSFYYSPMKIIGGIHDKSVGSFTKFSADVLRAYIPKSFLTRKSEFRYVGDIAVLKLVQSLNSSVNPFLVPLKLPSIRRQFVNEFVTVTGFGWNKVQVSFDLHGRGLVESGVSYGRMRFATATVLSRVECQGLIPSIPISSSMLCAKITQRGPYFPQGICTGDSGGPLVYNNRILVGIVSKGPVGCDETFTAGIYTRVSSYLDFIQKVIKDIPSSEHLYMDLVEYTTDSWHTPQR
ncbi:hypothetical protein QAD02_010289 [Eretmocerus hayati]|uniref:Uncharacterized protein n=1 Tax=Eretmocerus hayati TaxID=131215 RepID=A0ACC2NCH0_9HYME|nr:hypothetical protein QAD02_010289 [Eretmocerus hayati]